MSRNLFGISAKDVAIRAASCLYALVFCQALIHDTTWLWILSIAGGLVIIALSRAPLLHARTEDPAFYNRSNPIPPGTKRKSPHKPGAPAGVPPASGDEYSSRAGNRPPAAQPFVYEGSMPKLEASAVLGLQPILFDSPPICLN